MGNGRSHLRIVRIVAVAAVATFGPAHGLSGQFEEGVARAQSSNREAPQITSLTQPTTSSITVNWQAADNTDVHWIYVVKSDGSGSRFETAAAGDPRVTTVTGLDAGTQYWFAVLGARAPSESSPSGWFRWSNWANASTLEVATVTLGQAVAVAEGGTANVTVNLTPAQLAPLTVNYAIGVDDDPATVDGDSNDYAGKATGSVVIAKGAVQGVIPVVINDDSDIDAGARETLVVTISLPAGSIHQLGQTTSAAVTITEGVCDRTAAVRSALVAKIAGVSDCAEVTDPDLSGLTGRIVLSGEGLTALKARDFRGLTSLTSLLLDYTSLTSLPDDVFDGLTGLQNLILSNNSLASLPADVFDGLTSLTKLWLGHNNLASLPADVFDGAPGLQQLWLQANALTSLPDDLFDGPTGLTTLRLSNNALTSLPADISSTASPACTSCG